MAAAVVAISVAAGIALLVLTPHVGAAYAIVGIGLAVAAAAGIGGMALTVSRLVRRRLAWPYALATLLVCVLAVVLGWIVYVSTTG